MDTSPYLEPLSRKTRTAIFVGAILLFTVLVPLMVLYAVGYRFDFADENASIRVVGGLYIEAAAEGTEIYLNEERVDDFRLFQRAAYIQNITAGMQRVHVQGDGVTTWVKELPVFAHFVTEASSFTMPETPQVRVIAPFVLEGEDVFPATASSTVFTVADVTNDFSIATSSALLQASEVNPEYTFVEELFEERLAERALLERVEARQDETFFFADGTPATTTATTTREVQNRVLYEKDRELFVRWTGSTNDLPYYFCVNDTTPSLVSEWYGVHVADALYEDSVTGEIKTTAYEANGRLCREAIKLDTKRQPVTMFAFVPGRPDLVLLHLPEGVYVTEIDDRAWQNVQPLYEGSDLSVVVENGQIVLRDGDVYFELFTTLE